MLDISPHLVEGSEALYLQLYRYFCGEIQSRRLPSGTRLPSVRALSHHLRVSKTTVETAYHQLLAEGYLESRERSGFYVVDVGWDGSVSAGPQSSRQPVQTGKMEEPVPLTTVRGEHAAIRYDFHQAQVDAEHFPFELWRRYANQCMQRENHSVLYYGDRQGELELREEIARYLGQARGVQATAEQVVLGAGTQVMITLLGLMFGLRGQAVAMENPGYNGVRAVFQQLGFEVLPIPLEEDGIDVELLEKSGARLVYITPSHQDPTGIVMPYANASGCCNGQTGPGATSWRTTTMANFATAEGRFLPARAGYRGTRHLFRNVFQSIAADHTYQLHGSSQFAAADFP